MTKQVRDIVVVHPHAAVRDELLCLLHAPTSEQRNVHLTDSAGEALRALDALPATAPVCVLLAERLPETPISELLHALQGRMPEPAAVILLQDDCSADAEALRRSAALLRQGAQDVIGLRGLTSARLLHGIALAQERAAIARASQDCRLRLGLALQVASADGFDWDLADSELQRDDGSAIDVPTAERSPRSLAQTRALVHPDDRIAFDAVIAACLADGVAHRRADHRREGGASYRSSYRSLHADGTLHWVEDVGVVMCDRLGNPRRLTGVTRDITSRKRDADRRALLLAVARLALEHTADDADLAIQVFEMVRKTLDADVLFNYRRNADGSLQLVAGAGIPAAMLPAAQRLGPYQAFCSLASSTREPVVADVLRIAQDAAGAFVRNMGVQAYACHPLLGRDGQVLGTLSLASRRRRSFDALDVQFLQTVCHFVAIAWDRRRVDEARRRSEAQLASELADSKLLQQISATLIEDHHVDQRSAGKINALYERIVDAASTIMRSEFASFQMRVAEDGAADNLALLAFRGFDADAAQFWQHMSITSQTSCGRALRTAQRVIVPDIEACDFLRDTVDQRMYRQAGIRAVQSTPLLSRNGRLVGTVSTHWRAPHVPSERDLRLLDILARQAADLIERRQAEAALRASEERFRTLFESMDEGFCILEVDFDAQGKPCDFRTMEMNPAYEKHTGLRNVRGRSVREVIPGIDAFWIDVYGNVAQSGEPVRFVAQEKALGNRWFDVYAFRLGESGSRKVAVLFNDITVRREAELAVERAAAQRQLALDAAQLGWWQYDPIRHTAQWDERYKEIFGIGDDCNDLDVVLTRLHPDDRQRVMDAVQAALAPENPAPYAIEYRIRRPDGELRWVEAHGLALFESKSEAQGKGAPRRATSFVGTVADITDRKRVEETLREQDQRKDEFLATLAHELRNPLAPIRNGLEILRAGRVSADTATEVQQMMERQLRHLVRLVDDLLDVSRITRGKVELKRERIRLQAVLEHALETSAPVIDAAGHKLSLKLPQEPIWIDGDLTRLAQVVSNLLNNAAKYTPRGGCIELSAGVEPYAQQGAALQDQAFVRVVDNGTGISAEMLPRVFDLFAQGDRTLHRAQGGLGIGLSLVKKLIEMHGGSVSAESPPLGYGSTFSVHLPLALPRRDADAEHRLSEVLQPGAGQAKRVLVVDDNVDAAESLAMMLRLLGYETRTVHDGRAAIRAALTERPDVVFLDIGLPDLSGYEVARRLRAEACCAHMLLVALTGWGSDEDKRKSEQAGIDLHLTKPVEAARVEDVLARVSGGRRTALRPA